MQAEGGLMSITAQPMAHRSASASRSSISCRECSRPRASRRRSSRASVQGRGQAVDIAMLDSVAALLSYQAGIYFATGSAPSRMGNRHPTIVPYETFAASDGDFVIAVGNDEQWQRFCTVTGLEPEERFKTNRQRVTGYAELKPILDALLTTRPRADWIARLTAAGVPSGSVRDLHEVFSDPQLAARDMIAEVQHPSLGTLRTLGTPVKLSDTPGEDRRGAADARPTHRIGADRRTLASATARSPTCAPRRSSDGNL
jgi:crotonobetainyl-CoA:carnitine CoA-transferase CaiB-like acyl-CoA transferase